MTATPAGDRTRVYLDHAATAPLLPEAQAALVAGYEMWANPSSPHRPGRAVRAALEDARDRVKAALGWTGEVLFTSGATEALTIALTRCRLPLAAVSPVEHEAVLRLADGAARLPVDRAGRVDPAAAVQMLENGPGLVAVQQVNNETGVIQPLAEVAAAVRGAGGLLFADCAQAAGKLALPDADMICIAAHKFGGPIGIGALLLRDWSLIAPSGGQERGYRPGTENMPLACGMAAALEAGSGWMAEAARLRALLDAGILAAGGSPIAGEAPRIPTIGAYVMPGVSSAAQLIRFDTMGFAISAGSACSSGSMKSSHVIEAMGIDGGGEMARVSIGRGTTEAEIERFLDAWREIAAARKAA